MPRIRLRLAHPEDISQISQMEHLVFSTPWSPKAFEAELKKKGAYLWVLEKNGEILGYICFWVVAGEAHLANLAVRPAYRRQGLATWMLKTCIRFLKSRGIERILLEVREKNTSAQGLYQKLGFSIDGYRREYYRDTKEDAILMSLDLT